MIKEKKASENRMKVNKSRLSPDLVKRTVGKIEAEGGGPV